MKPMPLDGIRSSSTHVSLAAWINAASGSNTRRSIRISPGVSGTSSSSVCCGTTSGLMGTTFSVLALAISS
ncbi:hypothetical protein D3C75_1297580 [compost metagenome]